MNNKNKPYIKITLTKQYYNALFAMFDYYKASENHHGKTYQSHYSRTLEEKINIYGRYIKTESGDGVVVCFFENEAMQLLNIFINYICNGNERDYFTENKELQERVRHKLKAVFDKHSSQ